MNGTFEQSVDRCAEVIRARNHDLRAVLRVLDPPMRREPAAKDAPLAGVPCVLKDVWDTAGIVTTGGSYRHRNRVPDRTSRVVRAVLDSGAVVLGKSNLCDLAFSPESDNHLIGATRNPHDPSRTAGGSTGGGAAAVASGMASFEWGTDFGGSIRSPAAFCGVVGLRLSAQAWPVNEEHFPRVAPLFWSFLGMGPLTRRVDECRIVVHALRSLRLPSAEPRMLADDVVVYPPDARCAREWPTFAEDAGRALAAAGVRHELDRSLPASSEVNEIFNAYLCAHFTSFAATDEMSIPEGVGAVLGGLLTGGRLDKRIHPNTGILLGLVALGRLVRYRDPASIEERLVALRDATRRVWESGRLIVSPTVTASAPRHGRAGLDWSLQAFCKLGNLTDATAIALPFGRFASGLPRSLQILGPPGSEDAVLGLAQRLERKTEAQNASVATSSKSA